MAAAVLPSLSPFVLSPPLARFARSRFYNPRLRTPIRPLSASPLSSFSSPSASSSLSPPPTATETVASSPPLDPPSSSRLLWVPRTGYCGELGTNDVGKRVRLCVWVALHRIHGGLTFFNLRDSSGIVQVAAEHIIGLFPVNRALPFPVTISDNVKDTITEEIRLRYQFLDLHRAHMKFNLRLRHKVVKLIWRFLEDEHDFVELSHSKINPQLFKQMLMVSGFEKYYQIASYYVALSYFLPIRVPRNVKLKIFQEIAGVQLPNPFPRLTYAEAMKHYGSDRPDLRFSLELMDLDVEHCNAFSQIGGGSLRIYKHEVQEKILEIVGISHKQVKFNYIFFKDLPVWQVNALLVVWIPDKTFCRWNRLRFGSPSNAFGWFDLNTRCHCISKTTTAQCALTKAPSPVDPHQLRESSP
ncbi:hypothetical protein ZIOFF_018651 [Zingiber officinale]|uniref:Aminoacyl-tRNA synthetase class II (D/K/N) domain-containing protein n=1 Tax=Zingiber officinale TaxID=94328 RepID=A0A8J5HGP1_ZINOF|nr:hypothetical protein ZIOFF_018651 [Zingiber officinale]